MNPHPDSTVIISATCDHLPAESHNTINGERTGDLKSALDATDKRQLAEHYYALRCSPHASNPVFGGNFRAWERQVKDALLRQGVRHVAKNGCLGWHVLELNPEKVSS